MEFAPQRPSSWILLSCLCCYYLVRASLDIRGRDLLSYYLPYGGCSGLLCIPRRRNRVKVALEVTLDPCHSCEMSKRTRLLSPATQPPTKRQRLSKEIFKHTFTFDSALVQIGAYPILRSCFSRAANGQGFQQAQVMKHGAHSETSRTWTPGA